MRSERPRTGVRAGRSLRSRAVPLSAPRILFRVTSEDGEGQLKRCLGLAVGLSAAFPGGHVVLVSHCSGASTLPLPERLEHVLLPSPGPRTSTPLARRHLERVRRRLLNTLFDSLRPQLLILDSTGPWPAEHRELLGRAQAFGTPILLLSADPCEHRSAALGPAPGRPPCRECARELEGDARAVLSGHGPARRERLGQAAADRA